MISVRLLVVVVVGRTRSKSDDWRVWGARGVSVSHVTGGKGCSENKGQIYYFLGFL